MLSVILKRFQVIRRVKSFDKFFNYHIILSLNVLSKRNVLLYVNNRSIKNLNFRYFEYNSKSHNLRNQPSHVAEMSGATRCSSETKKGNSVKEVENNSLENEEKKHGMKVQYLDTPVKSLNDKKEYRVIQLENGLKALLIADKSNNDKGAQGDDANKEHAANSLSNESENEDSTDESDEDEEDESMEDSEEEEEEDGDDESSEQFNSDTENEMKKGYHSKKEEKMAACALCIGVGSFSDPPEIPGMAHFLEHMVFMGSERYPEENDFDAYVQKCGGSDNASTDCEHTTFYFEVQEKHLFQTLHRFAHFFIKPLMKRDAISREREAVESEFQMALPSDTNRKQQLFCSFAHDDHPGGKFMWGNSITLRDNIDEDKLYEELHKFKDRHYSAHRMTVAIQARLSLDTLENHVVECFGSVPSNGLPAEDFSRYEKASTFDTDKFRKIYKIKPIKDFCTLEITWNMPPLLKAYKSKPHQYVSWIIGHEGKGSLISYLRGKMWCLELYCGNNETDFESNSMYSFLFLCLVLTEEGYKNLDNVLDAVFSYINMLRVAGPQKRIYDEVHQIEKIKFRFVDEEEACDYVEDLSESMHFYEPKDYITGSELYFEYDPKGIQECINYLNADNMNIIICNKKFDEAEFDQVEPWFNTKYKVEEISRYSIERWKIIASLPEFHLPLPNIYLTDDFSLISLPSSIPEYPTKIIDNDKCELWYRPDPKFRLPICYMHFYFLSPLTPKSARTSSMTELYVNIMKQMLIEELYPATAAELEQECLPRNRGIEVKLSGFSQKLPLLLTTIFQYIADSPNLIKKELFDVMKEQQFKSYYNKVVKPGHLAKEIRFDVLIKEYNSFFKKNSALLEIEFDEFLDFVREFVSSTYIVSLIQGNITKEDAIRNLEICTKILRSKPAMPVLTILEVPKGINEIKVRNMNKTDVNSTMANYYQFDVLSYEFTAMADLIMTIMQEPLFNQLRTKEQLGYNVYCTSHDTYGVSGYSIVVNTQADKYTTEYVQERIDEFLKLFKQRLLDMSEEELRENQEALIKIKKQALVQLKEEVDRNWREIKTRDFVFDRVEREVEAIEKLTMEDVRNFLDNFMIDETNVRRLSIHVIGTKEGGGKINPKKEDDNVDGGKKPLKLEYVEEVQMEAASTNRIVDIESIDFPVKRISCK